MNINKLVASIGLLSLLSVMPLAAQIAGSENFTTSFPFYAGKAKLPPGSYKIIQPEADGDILQLQSSDAGRAVFIDVIPTQSAQPHPHSDVTFHKSGDTMYLDRIWVEGQEYGMKVDPTKVEMKTAANTNVEERSHSGN
jgi:hypothetical protein